MGRLTGRYFDVTNNRVHWSIKSNSTNDGLVATLQDVIDKLAHYEDLEEQGRLIELPCAVGDTVWHITEIHDEDGKRNEIYADWFEICDLPLLNKAMFLTREEALAKLKELEGDKCR